ncbi:MAG: DinB family protein [Ferruginibacter sp.]
MPKPTPGSYPVHFDNYINQVPEDNVLEALANQQSLVDDFFPIITEEKAGYAYAQGKWTLKELLQHVIDGERIFNYRALSIARGEQQSLPGFEEKDYASSSNANRRSWIDLVEELQAVRKTTILLFKSFTSNMCEQVGLANEKPVSVNALGFITVGHLYHHAKIIKERYLAN